MGNGNGEMAQIDEIANNMGKESHGDWRSERGGKLLDK